MLYATLCVCVCVCVCVFDRQRGTEREREREREREADVWFHWLLCLPECLHVFVCENIILSVLFQMSNDAGNWYFAKV